MEKCKVLFTQYEFPDNFFAFFILMNSHGNEANVYEIQTIKVSNEISINNVNNPLKVLVRMASEKSQEFTSEHFTLTFKLFRSKTE